MTRVRVAVLALFVTVLVACGADDRPIALVEPVTTTSEAPTTTVEVTTTTEAPEEATTTTTEVPVPEPTVARVRATTTVPAAPRATRATPSPAAPSTAARTGSGACGGSLPPCRVLGDESGGNITAVSPYGFCDGGDGRCHGKWQFDLDTWESLGYSGLPENASEAVQDQAARDLMARDGCGAWSTC